MIGADLFNQFVVEIDPAAKRVRLHDPRTWAAPAEREGPAVAVTLGAARIPVAAPIYSAMPNAVDGALTSTIGAGLFKDRRLVIDYPGARLFP